MCKCMFSFRESMVITILKVKGIGLRVQRGFELLVGIGFGICASVRNYNTAVDIIPRLKQQGGKRQLTGLQIQASPFLNFIAPGR